MHRVQIAEVTVCWCNVIHNPDTVTKCACNVQVDWDLKHGMHVPAAFEIPMKLLGGCRPGDANGYMGH